MISAAHMLGSIRGHVPLPPPKKIEKNDAIWCVFLDILIIFCLQKLSIFHVKKHK